MAKKSAPKQLMVRLMKRSGPLDEDGGNEDLFVHKSLAKSLAALETLAKEAKLAPLSKFVSEDPDNVYDLVDDEDEAEEWLAKLPPLRWSQPADALPTVAALVKALGGKNVPAAIKDPAKVLAELRDIECILKTGVAKKAKFRFYHEF